MYKIAILIGIFLGMSSASAKVLIDESADQSLLSRSGAAIARSKEAFDDLASFKRKKKMGISTTLAGATGLFGINLDLNIFEDFAISLGGGVSHGFSSYNMHIKQTLGVDAFQPYMVFGYSRWFSDGGGPVSQTSPGLLVHKFLSEGARQSGQFAENIIYPALGLQYVNLTGEYQGFGVFAEVMVLMDLNNLAVGPSAGTGAIYYF
jgi:hypothetical protein